MSATAMMSSTQETDPVAWCYVARIYPNWSCEGSKRTGHERKEVLTIRETCTLATSFRELMLKASNRMVGGLYLVAGPGHLWTVMKMHS